MAQDHARDDKQYSLIPATSPFAGSSDYENTVKDLLDLAKTKEDRVAVPDAIVAPAETRRPRRGPGVSAAILLFTMTSSGDTDHIGF